MNTAFLMLTSAWLAGADPVPAAQPAAPIVASSSCNGCGGGCNSGCGNTGCCEEAKKPGLFARLCAGKKHDDCGCDSCNTCEKAPRYKEPKCKEPRAPKCKAPKAESCNTCEDSCGKKPGLFARLCGKKHDDCGCGGDSGCGCGSASAGYGYNGGGSMSMPVGTPAPETAPAPKNGAPGKTTLFNRTNTPSIVSPY